jgi:hypothetical protein
VRIVVDYRAALRERTGVGEFVHELVRALSNPQPPTPLHQIVLFTSSWKDRPLPGLPVELPGTSVVDWRLPVRFLTWSWNRLEWPPIEWLAGACSVVHSQSPLLIPASTAAQVVTIHDLSRCTRPRRGRVVEVRGGRSDS